MEMLGWGLLSGLREASRSLVGNRKSLLRVYFLPVSGSHGRGWETAHDCPRTVGRRSTVARPVPVSLIQRYIPLEWSPHNSDLSCDLLLAISKFGRWLLREPRDFAYSTPRIGSRAPREARRCWRCTRGTFPHGARRANQPAGVSQDDGKASTQEYLVPLGFRLRPCRSDARRAKGGRSASGARRQSRKSARRSG